MATITSSEHTAQGVQKIVFGLTHATDDSTGNTTTTNTYDGEIVGVVSDMSTGAAGWTFTLTDKDGVDLSWGHGSATGRSATAAEYIYPTDKIGPAANTTLTLNVTTSSGTAHDGKVYVYIR